MNIIILLGKGLSALFWAAVVYNSGWPFDSPIGPLFSLSGPMIMIIHVFESFFFIRQFKHRVPNLSVEALQVLAFGIFHILVIRERLDKEKAQGAA